MSLIAKVLEEFCNCHLDCFLIYIRKQLPLPHYSSTLIFETSRVKFYSLLAVSGIYFQHVDYLDHCD